MGKRFDKLLFPGHKTKVFTLSYDDGVRQDKRLIDIFDKYGLKCTFNLGYEVLGFKSPATAPFDVSKFEKDEVREIYRNHEVGGHGLYHSDPSTIGSPYAMYEILEDKAGLEKLINKPLKMYAYPFGLFNKDTKEFLKIAGYKGARTVKSTHTFDIPQDPWELNPTCHHKDEKLYELLEQFINLKTFKPCMFYLWGHSYEFDKDDNWEIMEKAADIIGPHGDEIWFATNGEILSYLEAYKMLEYSVDGSMIYNPSCTDIEIMTAFGQYETLKAGELTYIRETPL